MSNPYVGEIRPLGFNFAPQGWAFCNGQSMPISQNEVLFTIIGTTYGGDGQSTFNMPNLQGRASVHQGTGTGLSPYVVGQPGGVADVTLTTNQIPLHSHSITSAETTVASQRSITPGTSYIPGPSAPANGFLASGAANAPFSPRAITSSGNSLPHENMQPYLTLNFCISLFGIFPTQN